MPLEIKIEWMGVLHEDEMVWGVGREGGEMAVEVRMFVMDLLNARLVPIP